MLNLLGLGTVARAGSVWDGMRRRGTAPDGIGRHRTSSRLTVEAVFKLASSAETRSVMFFFLLLQELLFGKTHQLTKQRLKCFLGQNLREEIREVVFCVNVLRNENILVSEHLHPVLACVNVLQSGLERCVVCETFCCGIVHLQN